MTMHECRPLYTPTAEQADVEEEVCCSVCEWQICQHTQERLTAKEAECLRMEGLLRRAAQHIVDPSYHAPQQALLLGDIDKEIGGG